MGIGTIWTYRDIIKREQGLEAAIEFEQVVKKYQAEQIGFERERIIKLLEDPNTMSNWWAMPDKSLGLYGNLKNYVIALIKGEK